MTQIININLVITRLQLYFPFFANPKTAEIIGKFRQDGSFVQILPEKETENPNELFRGVDSIPLLEYDLQTLSAIARQGITIVIYESPLSPRIYHRIEKNLSVNAHSVREKLIKKCAQLGLHYYAAPYLGNNPQNLVWPDTTHPPAQLLGLWLQGVIDEVENKTKKPGINSTPAA